MTSVDFARVTALTLDCYGTLIDWETGAIEALRPLLARHGVAHSDDEIIDAFQEIEEPLCEPPHRSYRAVLAGVVEGFGRRYGFPVGAAERELLTTSLPAWRPFPDTVDALRALKSRYQLVILSNIDNDLFAATNRQLGVAFDHIVTAEQVRSYKPRSPIFEEGIRRLGATPGAIAHVAEGASEVSPARRLGCATVWVRRHGRSAKLLTEAPDLEVADLRSFLARMNVDG
jgi:2-haloacid dehalogenase